MGMGRSAALGKVAGRGHDRQTEVGSDFYGNHVWRHQFSQSDTGIESIVREVAESCVNVHLDLYVRVVSDELLQHRP
ncbi:hypothetical protein WT25_04470 [Burkholderia territorii]|nr:hypothetical protein WS94_18245 [Burkholderia territorii]KVT89201.1 hypothetical protein WT25_04470 [Burkholderia territorii]